MIRVARRVQTAWQCLGLSLEVNWLALGEPFLSFELVGTGRAISILFGINGVKNKRSHLVRPPVPEHSRPVFQLRQVYISQET